MSEEMCGRLNVCHNCFNPLPDLPNVTSGACVKFSGAWVICVFLPYAVFLEIHFVSQFCILCGEILAIF